MNILVTGAKGFLGSTLYHLLSFHNKVFSLGRFDCDYNVDLAYNKPSFDINFDLVIHAAGRAHIESKSKFDEDKFLLDNIEATKNLLGSFTQFNKPKYFLLISTVSVYGIDTGCLINENTTPIPKDIYGKTKLECEKLVKIWCDEMNIVCTIFRLPLVVGLNPKGNLKSMISGIQKGLYFNINNGVARRSMVLSTDIVKVIPNAVLIGGTYNLTDGMHPSYFEISKIIAKHFNKKKIISIPYSFALVIVTLCKPISFILPLNYSRLKKMSNSLTFCDQKARKLINWSPTPVVKGFRLE